MNNLTINRMPELDYGCTEAINTLCTNLSYCGKDIKVVQFTSRYEQEGKSSIAMHVMKTMAGFGKKVLLIDADLRCSALARRYRFTYEQGDDPKGLAHYLAGMCKLDDAVYYTNIPNAYIIPCGRYVLNSLQLLATEQFGAMMDVLRKNFDYIIVDTPPAGMIVDAVEIARYCDGAVIVVGYNRGTVQDVAKVSNSIAKTGCTVLGAVMNGVELQTFRNRRYYYRSEGYTYYYRHYGSKSQGGKKKKRNNEQ